MPKYSHETLIDISRAEDLQKFATDFSHELRGGDKIGLIGGLGAGKTTFTQAVSSSLGGEIPVESPTFILRHSILIPNHPTITHLVHLDLYRLDEGSSLADVAELGLQDDWEDPQTLVMIEWVDRVPALLSHLTYQLDFSWETPSNRRTIQVTRRIVNRIRQLAE